MKDWEVVADNLKKAGWSLGWVSAIDSPYQFTQVIWANALAMRFGEAASLRLIRGLPLESGGSR
jgi:hypothetical protein